MSVISCHKSIHCRHPNDLWESHIESCHSNGLWVLQPNSNPPKEIPMRIFNNLALFKATDYAI